MAVIWSPEARAELRGIGREIAVLILLSLDRFLVNVPAI